MRTFQGFKMPIPKYYKDRMFTEEKNRGAFCVAKRMQKRIDDLIRKKKSQYPHLNVNDVLNLIDDNKKLIKFDTRKKKFFDISAKKMFNFKKKKKAMRYSKT